MDGLMAVCHATRKGGYKGSHWPTHTRASALLDKSSSLVRFISSNAEDAKVHAEGRRGQPQRPLR